MERIFQQNCNSWGKIACKSKDLNDLYRNKVIEGKKFKLPEGKKLEKYNKICFECDMALEIKERKCPICGSDRLNHQPLVSIKNIVIPLYDIKSPACNTYNYRCNNCRRFLYSTKKL